MDDSCVSFLRNLDPESCELATHLHGEYVEPSAKYKGPDFSGCDPGEMQCDYPEEIEFRKLETLTHLFVDKMGTSAKSFRAGRFGARGWTLECLRRLDYTHDSSVSPFRNWYGKADFSQAKLLAPYLASSENLLSRGESGITEVPITITPQRVWLRPTPGFSDLSTMEEVIRWYEGNVSPLTLCCMFHNVELVPGKSPSSETAADCEMMFERLEGLFGYISRRDYQSKTVSEVTV